MRHHCKQMHKIETKQALTCSFVVKPLERMLIWKIVKLTTGKNTIPTRAISTILHKKRQCIIQTDE